MRRRPSRTHGSGLTDDLLLIFDALFDRYDTLPSLLRGNYWSYHNLPYTHDMADHEVGEAIRGLMSDGLVTSRVKRGSKRTITFYGLTAAGGRVWEVEREPRWDRFCVDFSDDAEDGGPGWQVLQSPSAETLWEFLEVAGRCGLEEIDPSRASMTLHRDYELVPWKTFPAVYELRAPAAEGQPARITDWALYESGRTWWRCVMELGGLAG